MEDIHRSVSRIISDKPIYSRFEGFCNVCKAKFYPGEQISPYFENEKNYYRHTGCLQLFFIVFKFPGECNKCKSEIKRFSSGYWSKHNGIWCLPCGESLRPKVVIAFSKLSENYLIKIRNIG